MCVSEAFIIIMLPQERITIILLTLERTIDKLLGKTPLSLISLAITAALEYSLPSKTLNMVKIISKKKFKLEEFESS